MHYIRIWSSRTGNVWHASLRTAFAFLSFNKLEEVQHSIVIPSDSHSGINYPPFANADGFETTDCLECLQILDILIYGRRVCFRLWSSRTGNVLHAPPLCSFRILTFLQKNIPLRPCNPQGVHTPMNPGSYRTAGHWLAPTKSVSASIISCRYFFLSFPGDRGRRRWGLLCLS